MEPDYAAPAGAGARLDDREDAQRSRTRSPAPRTGAKEGKEAKPTGRKVRGNIYTAGQIAAMSSKQIDEMMSGGGSGSKA